MPPQKDDIVDEDENVLGLVDDESQDGEAHGQGTGLEVDDIIVEPPWLARAVVPSVQQQGRPVSWKGRTKQQ